MGRTCKCCRLLMPGRFHSQDVPPPLKDVDFLFSHHAVTPVKGWPPRVGTPHMDEDGLRRCLDDSKVDGDPPRHDIFWSPQKRPPRRQLFTLVDFRRILFSHDLNPPIRPQPVRRNMTLPLSHYFIYSSGQSGESIIRQLKMGVRAIEVAMSPNSERDDIEIHHGWTRNLLLAECLKSIREHAFVASPYPVIITLEDKLQSSNLQKKAAKVVLDVLGDILYWPHTDHIDVRGNTDSNNPLKEFPSPEELKGRVLLSTKAPRPIIREEHQLGRGADDNDDAPSGAQLLKYEIQSVKMHDGDDEYQKNEQRSRKQPHEYPPYHHLITFRAEKQEEIVREYHDYPPPTRVPPLPSGPEYVAIGREYHDYPPPTRVPPLPSGPKYEAIGRRRRSTLESKPHSAQLQLGRRADGDDAAWWAQLPDFKTEIHSAKKHGGDVSGHQRWRNNDNDDEDQKEQKMQPHAYPQCRHLITIPNEPEAIERVPILTASGGLRVNKTIERVPILLGRGGLRVNNIIERVSTLDDEPSEVWRRGAIERVPRRGGFIRTNKTIERVSTLESEPRRRRFPGDGGPFPHIDPEKKNSEHEWVHVGSDIVRFTQRNILRIYPSIFSSNYNPFVGWVYGAQMVALNMQEYGRELWLMHGFYRANGGCGYVRKPKILMQKKPEVFDPRKRQPVKTTLKVKVYMGDGWLADFKHAHTSFIPDLWTSVGIAGVPADTTAMKDTKATENTWVPVWEDEFSFPLTVPEIALLRLEVHQYDASEKDVFGGQTVLPVWELRPGIRAVALFDRQGNRLPNVKLLMRFEFV